MVRVLCGLPISHTNMIKEPIAGRPLLDDVFRSTMENATEKELDMLMDFMRDNRMYSLADFIKNYYVCHECKDLGKIEYMVHDELISRKCQCVLR